MLKRGFSPFPIKLLYPQSVEKLHNKPQIKVDLLCGPFQISCALKTEAQKPFAFYA